jgi:hypothetical protein
MQLGQCPGMNTQRHVGHLRCYCGTLDLAVAGDPIMTVACYCRSCQTAGGQLALPNYPPVVAADGGTPFVLFRKDRVNWSVGPGALAEHRLSRASSTRRVVATCCGAPLFLEFEKGHWVSVYAERLAASARPNVEMRTMTRDAPAGSVFNDGIPSYGTHALPFMARLFWAWARMGFRVPEIGIEMQPWITPANE